MWIIRVARYGVWVKVSLASSFDDANDVLKMVNVEFPENLYQAVFVCPDEYLVGVEPTPQG